jgi:hypothetical protein
MISPSAAEQRQIGYLHKQLGNLGFQFKFDLSQCSPVAGGLHCAGLAGWAQPPARRLWICAAQTPNDNFNCDGVQLLNTAEHLPTKHHANDAMDGVCRHV